MNIDIISDFYQGSVVVSKETQKCLKDNVLGNCVTIALIKSALVEFGSIEKIFTSYAESKGTISCTFFDGLKLTVSKSEIKTVEKICGIKFKRKAKYYASAVKLYSIIAKRVLLRKDNYSKKCIHNFKNAVEYLNSGFPTKKAPELLALSKKKIKRKKIKKYKSVIIWSSAHAAYCSYGGQDVAGKRKKIKNILGVRWMKNLRGIGAPVSGAYILKRSQ